jgi:nitrate reductase NapAB chaperone NapD
MKLKEYLEKLQELYETYGDLELIYSSDDEGNYYDRVTHLPDIVNFNMVDKEVIHDDDIEEYSEDEYSKVICIN